MNLFKNIKNILGIHPSSPNEFVQKFIYDSKKSRVQLEMIYNKDIILQVDSLKFTTSWFKIVNIEPKDYQDGYVIFFLLDKENLSKNLNFQNYKNSELDMIKIEEMHGSTEVITFAKFIKHNTNLAQHMREIINGVYSFKEQNPQILFNLRYLDDVDSPPAAARVSNR